MKVIIAGSRNFSNYGILKTYCNRVLSNVKEEIEIVSGTAKGADMLGEQYAIEMGYKLTRFPADWNLFGKAAGAIRNKQMADYSDALIAFWDGRSRGTLDMIYKAKQAKLKLRVLKIK